jgi:outer membrane protein TolC
MLGLEKENYDLFFRRLGRTAEQAVEKCALLDKKRSLAVAALELETERYHLSEKKMELGKLTRIELMNARLDYAAKEAAAVEAAAAVLEAERELENFLDLEPGELQAIAKWDYNTRGGSL